MQEPRPDQRSTSSVLSCKQSFEAIYTTHTRISACNQKSDGCQSKKILIKHNRISDTLAPLILRIPISLVRDADTSITSPKSESAVMITAIRLNRMKHLNKLDMRFILCIKIIIKEEIFKILIFKICLKFTFYLTHDILDISIPDPYKNKISSLIAIKDRGFYFLVQ